MNQDQQFLVNNLQKMIKYIQQETDKKVQMIKKEAAKDADLEKALLINPEKIKIAKKMEKELENYKTSMKIEQSKKMNKLRLEKLKVKIDCVNSVFEEAKNQLALRIKNDEDGPISKIDDFQSSMSAFSTRIESKKYRFNSDNIKKKGKKRKIILIKKLNLILSLQLLILKVLKRKIMKELLTLNKDVLKNYLIIKMLKNVYFAQFFENVDYKYIIIFIK